MKLRVKINHLFADQRTHYWIFVVALIVPNIFLCCTEPLGIWATMALLLVPCAVNMAFLLISRRPGIPMLVLFPMFILGALQLVLLYLYGNSIVAADMFLTIANTNSNEAIELLAKLMPSIAGVCLLYIPMILLSVVSIRCNDRLAFRFRRHIALIALLIGSIGLGTVVLAKRSDPKYAVKRHLWPCNIFYNMWLAGEYRNNMYHYFETSAGFTFEAVSERPDSVREVYIMVIGETSRTLNWQLYGYGRPTNPQLSQLPGLVHFADIFTQSNYTYKSVPILLSSSSAEHYDEIYRRKSLIAAYREAGFRTAFFSNQVSSGSYVDFYANEADTAYFLKKHLADRTLPHEPFDSEFFPMVDSEMARGASKQLIVLHTYGSHFDYRERYDESQRFFTPDDYSAINMREREKMVNAYDNTVRNTDLFISLLINRFTSIDGATALFYISDHGEDLLDDRRKCFLHASPLPTYYQLHVPMLLWFSSRYDTLWPVVRLNAEANREKPATTNVAFHTMLSIGGVATKFRNDSLSVVSGEFTVTPRRYLDDHRCPQTFDRIGLKAYDVDVIRKLGLQYP